MSGELGVWTDWSEWSGCVDPGDYVATRTRKCLTRDTLEPTSVDRCLLIPGNKSDLDLMPCRIYLSQNSDLDEYFTVPPPIATSTRKEVIEQPAPVVNKVAENGNYTFRFNPRGKTNARPTRPLKITTVNTYRFSNVYRAPRTFVIYSIYLYSNCVFNNYQ